MRQTPTAASIAMPQQHALCWFEELDSTNAEALRRAVHGVDQPLWIAARKQTAGRGRHGRTWESPIGNLMTSLLLPDVPLRRASDLTFVAGLAMRKVVTQVLDGVLAPDMVQLKWPNDVLVDGKKVAGILLEIYTAPRSFGSESMARWGALVIGMGLNLVESPNQAQWPAASLAHWHRDVPEPKAVLPLLAQAFAHFYDMWQSQGFAPLRTQWLGHAYGLGKPMRVRLGDELVDGCFVSLEHDGAICLETPKGRRVLLAGDVFFGAA